MSDKSSSTAAGVEDVLASIRKLVSDEARVRSDAEQLEAQRQADAALKAEAEAQEQARAQAKAEEEAAAKAAAEAEAEAEALAKAAEEAAKRATAEAEAAEQALLQAEEAQKAEELAKAEADRIEAAQAEAAQAEAAKLKEAMAAELSEPNPENSELAPETEPETRAGDVSPEAPPFLTEQAPLVLTSSQRVAETVSASAKQAARAPVDETGNQAPDVADNSAALPSFLAVDGAAKPGSLIEDMPDEDSVQVEDLVAPNRTLDDAATRELVRALVREELRGEMGERITHNLRKLIRREIAAMVNQGAKS